jgi:hypothetical protein
VANAAHFSPETVRLMRMALDNAWNCLEPGAQATVLRTTLAVRIRRDIFISTSQGCGFILIESVLPPRVRNFTHHRRLEEDRHAVYVVSADDDHMRLILRAGDSAVHLAYVRFWSILLKKVFRGVEQIF